MSNPKSGNTNRRHSPDRPPYTGDGLECIATLTPDTNEPHVLLAVATWHQTRRRGKRHEIIADALRQAAAGHMRVAA